MKNIHHYDFIPFDDVTLPIRINYGTTLPALRIVPNKFSWHEQIEILYFIRGNANVYCGNKTIVAFAGDVVLINPYEIHQITHHSDSPLYHCLMIDASLYRNPIEGSCETNYFNLLSSGGVAFDNYIAKDSGTAAHIEALCSELQKKDYGYELAIKAHTFGLLTNLFRSHIRYSLTHQSAVNKTDRYECIKRALVYIQANYKEQISLEQIAASGNLSVAHLCRLFREITGTTPIRLLTRIRLQEAASLLQFSNMSISLIAAEVGFLDDSYFGRKFKAEYKLSPLQYRKLCGSQRENNKAVE